MSKSRKRVKRAGVDTLIMLVSMIVISCLTFGAVWAYFNDKQSASGNSSLGKLSIELKNNSATASELVAVNNLLPGQYLLGSKTAYEPLSVDLSSTSVNAFIRVKVDVTLNNITAINAFKVDMGDNWYMHYDGYMYNTLDPSLGANSIVYEVPANATTYPINIKLQLKPSTTGEYMDLSGHYRITVDAIQADYLHSSSADTTYTINNLGDIWQSSASNEEIFVVEDGVITGVSEYAKNNLTTIVLPSTTTTISANAFNGCKNLTSVVIPDTVTEIGAGAFQNCTSLQSVTIPDGVASIESNTFRGCTNLTNIVLSSTLQSISSQGFYNTGLTSIELPEGLTTIGGSAFSGSTKITEIYIPASVTYVQGAVNTGLTKLVVSPNNARYTSRDAEGNECNVIIEKATNTLIIAIKNCTIPDTVTKIGDSAFSGKNIQSIVIPKSVVEIDGTTMGVFAYNDSLTSIIVDKDNPVYTSRDSANNECNVIVKKATNTLIAGCATSVISDNVNIIANRAFYGTKVSTITIPNNVTKIERYAFFNAPLTSVTFTSPTGWKATYNTTIIPLVLTDPATNARYLSSTYCGYDWIKE